MTVGQRFEATVNVTGYLGRYFLLLNAWMASGSQSGGNLDAIRKLTLNVGGSLIFDLLCTF